MPQLPCGNFASDHITAVLNERNPLADRAVITPADLNRQTLLLLEKGSSIRNHIEQTIRFNRIAPAAVIDCTEIYSMMGMIGTDGGIGFLSSKVAEQYTGGPVRSIPLDPPLRSNTALIFSKRTPYPEELRLLLQCMRLQTGSRPADEI